MTDGHGRFRRFRNSAIAFTFADRLTGIECPILESSIDIKTHEVGFDVI
jgi:hypothetical protein